MKYRLAFDIGTGSIGTSVLSLNENNHVTDILDAGICIFEASEGAEDRRIKRGQRKNTYRTKKRINLLSEQLTNAGLWSFDEDIQDALIKLSPYAIRAQGVNGKLNDIMQLGRAILHMAKHRGAGFVEMNKLELELEKATEQEDGKKKNKKPSEYAMLIEHLNKSGAKTVGEYFFMRLHPSYKNNNIKDENRQYVRQRTKGGTKVDYAIPRYLVKDEFNRLWDTQSKYYKKLKDKQLKEKIYNILFYEHDHRPYAIGNCIFIEDEPRLPKAHPLNEKRRIYEAVNNIIIEELDSRRKLEKEERDKVINELLYKGTKIGKKAQAIKKLLGFGKDTNLVLADAIKPYLYSTPEYLSIDLFKNLDDDELGEIVDFMAEPRRNDKPDYLYNEEKTIEILKDKLNTKDDKLISQLLAMLPKGRGSLGKTATVEILKLLKEDVISNREATDKLSRTDNRFIAEEERARQIQGKYDKLPYYGKILTTDVQPIAGWQKKINKSLNPDEAKYGKIPNPAVHRILNQLRKVVNDIVRIYGRPYDINIELAREVGMSSKKKKAYESRRDENKKLNDNAAEYLIKNKVRVTRDNILKWRLAVQQNWQDAFDLERIHPRFEGFEIEHLVPGSRGGTDAPVNLALVKRSHNQGKGNLYAYEYLKDIHGDKVHKILEFVRGSNMPDGKKWRFESDAREIFESGEDVDNITRYLTDTRYVCKMAARYLKAIVDYKPGDENNTRVLTINGGHTAKLRSLWNLDGIEYELMELEDQVPKYLPCEPYYLNKDTGEVLNETPLETDGNWEYRDKKRNENWQKKPRFDHRHHIVDAITIGFVSRYDMQKINWHDKRGQQLPFKQLPVPLSNGNDENLKKQTAIFREKVKETLKDVKVYHKPEHSTTGRLHEETGKYALMPNPIDSRKIITRYNRPVSKQTVLKDFSTVKNILINTSTIKPQWHDDIARDVRLTGQLKEDIENTIDQAKSELEQENKELLAKGSKARNISEAMILQHTFNIIRDKGKYKYDTYPVYENSESLVFIEKHKVAYKGGGNHRMDFYEDDKGKVGWECITMFNANDKDFVPQWKQSGFKPIWSLHKGDMIEMNTPKQWQKYTNSERCFAAIDACHEKLGITFHTDARSTQSTGLDVSVRDSFIRRLSFYTEHEIRKIELTPFGKIGRKHKKLWYGKKETT